MDLKHRILNRIISIIVLFSYCGMIIRPCVAMWQLENDPCHQISFSREYVSFLPQEKLSSFRSLEDDSDEFTQTLLTSKDLSSLHTPDPIVEPLFDQSIFTSPKTKTTYSTWSSASVIRYLLCYLFFSSFLEKGWATNTASKINFESLASSPTILAEINSHNDTVNAVKDVIDLNIGQASKLSMGFHDLFDSKEDPAYLFYKSSDLESLENGGSLSTDEHLDDAPAPAMRDAGDVSEDTIPAPSIVAGSLPSNLDTGIADPIPTESDSEDRPLDNDPINTADINHSVNKANNMQYGAESPQSFSPAPTLLPILYPTSIPMTYSSESPKENSIRISSSQSEFKPTSQFNRQSFQQPTNMLSKLSSFKAVFQSSRQFFQQPIRILGRQSIPKESSQTSRQFLRQRESISNEVESTKLTNVPNKASSVPSTRASSRISKRIPRIQTAPGAQQLSTSSAQSISQQPIQATQPKNQLTLKSPVKPHTSGNSSVGRFWPRQNGAAGQAFGQKNIRVTGTNSVSLGSLGSSGIIITGGNTGDFAGYCVKNAGDVNGDGINDLLIVAPGYSSNTGAVYLIYGGSGLGNTNLGSLGSKGIILTNAASGTLMYASSAGDMNSDGKADLLIGAPGYFYKGIVYLMHGGNSLGNTNLEGTSGITRITGANSYDLTGQSICNIGDVSGDGTPDFLIGIPGYSSNTGRVDLIYGKSNLGNIDLSQSLGSSGTVFSGLSAGDQAGFSVSGVGDVNGDGTPDFAYGAPGYSSNTGRVSLIYGGGSSGITITGANPGDKAGYFVSGVGDVNGDGIPDFLIGAPDYSSNKGAAYLIYGKSGGLTNVDLGNLGNSGIIFIGENIGDLLGSAGSSAGDVNRDGINDFVIGAPGYSSSTGKAYLVFGGKN
ncbi:MAG: FG-GAP-like repeat-containing protein, partial [Alphaproteobacteria bacterium]|nr:FG-GAP-like repeat-containing protein [Alphaproteobacteria bacterium]